MQGIFIDVLWGVKGYLKLRAPHMSSILFGDTMVPNNGESNGKEMENEMETGG